MESENENNGKQGDSWSKIYGLMVNNQKMMADLGLYDNCLMTVCRDRDIKDYNIYINDLRKCDCDVPQIAAYNLLHLTTEVSEVLQADKRWKSIRKEHVDKSEKLEEIADCFICLFNVAIWSGFDADTMCKAIEEKSATYSLRICSELDKIEAMGKKRDDADDS